MSPWSQVQFRTDSLFSRIRPSRCKGRGALVARIQGLMETVTARPSSRLWLHLLLFVLTLGATLSAYLVSFAEVWPGEVLKVFLGNVQLRTDALAFSLAL